MDGLYSQIAREARQRGAYLFFRSLRIPPDLGLNIASFFESFGELEGGEAVINKRSTSMFGSVLSQINQAGGGRKFRAGGVVGAPVSAPSLAGSSVNQDLSKFLEQQQAQTQAINNRIDRIQVVQHLNNLQDIQDNDNTLDTLTTFN